MGLSSGIGPSSRAAARTGFTFNVGRAPYGGPGIFITAHYRPDTGRGQWVHLAFKQRGVRHRQEIGTMPLDIRHTKGVKLLANG
jgi:hypothetical protein